MDKNDLLEQSRAVSMIEMMEPGHKEVEQADQESIFVSYVDMGISNPNAETDVDDVWVESQPDVESASVVSQPAATSWYRFDTAELYDAAHHRPSMDSTGSTTTSCCAGWSDTIGNICAYVCCF